MNENVRLPIETTREGDKITKVCVEDIYKIVNRVYDSMNKAYNNSVDILEEIKKKYWSDVEDNTYYDGYLIIGNGISQPCGDDEFDEEIGNDIAFMKAKLNANIKKYNALRRVHNNYVKCMEGIDTEIEKIIKYIEMDIKGIRKYNPDYLRGKIREDEV